MDTSCQKKAVVVGGSNGIGLSIVKELIRKDYYVIICDKLQPDSSLNELEECIQYYNCDLLYYEEDLFNSLALDQSIDCLMITAGFGRVSNFEYIHEAEIKNLFEVNTVSALRIIKAFYNRINSNDPFFCGIMGSIAGLINSPMFSVYAASKAAICRFVESVNIELEAGKKKNRILNVSPGSIKGTRFNGALKNDFDETKSLASTIVTMLMASQELFIPQYEEVFKRVINENKANPHEFGLNSYAYKISSGRAINEEKVVIGYLSGTFDLFHIGHLNLLKRAKAQCDYLIVGVHPNASHKGKQTFIPFDERKEILRSIKYVDKVVQSCPEDSDAWNLWHYNKLFVGSDYKGTERFNNYERFFADKNVEIVYFPYTKGTSSTQIRNVLFDDSQ